MGAPATQTGAAGAVGHPSPTSGLGPSGGTPRAGFTPGAWAVFRDAYGGGLFIDTALGMGSTNGMVVAGQVHGHQKEANAHLIAAAPELYEALETLLKTYGVCPELEDCPHCKRANAALAKARGEA